VFPHPPHAITMGRKPASTVREVREVREVRGPNGTRKKGGREAWVKQMAFHQNLPKWNTQVSQCLQVLIDCMLFHFRPRARQYMYQENCL
jgi:hypothetical protein